MRCAWIFGVTLVLFSFIGSGQPANASSFKASFRVWVTVKGGPLPGAAVTLKSGSYKKTFETDEYGRVLFIGLHPGQYQLTTSMPGFGTDDTVLTFRVGSILDYQVHLQLPFQTNGCTLIVLPPTMQTIRRTWRLKKDKTQ